MQQHLLSFLDVFFYLPVGLKKKESEREKKDKEKGLTFQFKYAWESIIILMIYVLFVPKMQQSNYVQYFRLKELALFKYLLFKQVKLEEIKIYWY